MGDALPAAASHKCTPSMGCPPCHCPAASPQHPIPSCPAKGSSVLHRSWMALQGLWPATMPLPPGHDLLFLIVLVLAGIELIFFLVVLCC